MSAPIQTDQFFSVLSLTQEGDHVVYTLPVDVPLKIDYTEETGVLVVELPSLMLGNAAQAVVLRLRVSPAAARSLARALRAIEKTLGKEIGEDPPQSM